MQPALQTDINVLSAVVPSSLKWPRGVDLQFLVWPLIFGLVITNHITGPAHSGSPQNSTKWVSNGTQIWLLESSLDCFGLLWEWPITIYNFVHFNEILSSLAPHPCPLLSTVLLVSASLLHQILKIQMSTTGVYLLALGYVQSWKLVTHEVCHWQFSNSYCMNDLLIITRSIFCNQLPIFYALGYVQSRKSMNHEVRHWWFSNSLCMYDLLMTSCL